MRESGEGYNLFNEAIENKTTGGYGSGSIVKLAYTPVAGQA